MTGVVVSGCRGYA